MNEAEARKKWCPEARVWSPEGGYNRESHEGGVPAGTMCLGHGCMAFVFDREAYETAVDEYNEADPSTEGSNVVSLVGGRASPVPAAERREKPKESDFYKCGKVFPEFL